MDDVDVFYNIGLLKTTLINSSIEDLCKKLENQELFFWFLNSLILLVINDKEFLMLDNKFIFRILSAFSEHMETDDKSAKETIDILISLLKELCAYSKEEKFGILAEYKLYNEYVRNCSLSDEELLFCIANDGVLLMALKNDQLNLVANEPSVFLSLDYLLYTCPDFFEDVDVNKRAVTLIDRVCNNSELLSSYQNNAIEIKKDLCKILKKEE